MTNQLPALWNTDLWSNDFTSGPSGHMRREMAKLLGHFMDDIPLAERRKPHGEIAFAPRLNVAETDDALELTAEMPGLTSDDVDVSLSGNLLTIKGKREAKKEEKKKDYHLVESRYGSFYRAMQLPFNVDPAKINAACKDGVLTVTVPKPVEMANKTQKITVKK